MWQTQRSLLESEAEAAMRVQFPSLDGRQRVRTVLAGLDRFLTLFGSQSRYYGQVSNHLMADAGTAISGEIWIIFNFLMIVE